MKGIPLFLYTLSLIAFLFLQPGPVMADPSTSPGETQR